MQLNRIKAVRGYSATSYRWQAFSRCSNRVQRQFTVVRANSLGHRYYLYPHRRLAVSGGVIDLLPVMWSAGR